MARERTTWNRQEIAKAAGLKVADPYSMNQDHVRQQPPADKYVTGDPSAFAEDVHSPNTWEAEYSGGQVKRNEIGMPEMRPETFNHPEKTASEEVITRKAALCVAIARAVLPKTASDDEITDQSYSFMHLPDADIMATYTRLAGQQDQDQDQGEQEQKQAGQMPPQFRENAEKKKEEAEAKKEQGQDKEAQDQGQQDQGQSQQKQAQQEQMAQMQQQMAQFQQQLAQMQQQGGSQQMLAQMQQQGQQLMAQLQQLQAQQEQQQVQAQQQQVQSQQQQMMAQWVQQGMQQGMDPAQAATYAAQQMMAMQPQQQMGQQQVHQDQDGALIDVMLASGGGIAAPPSEMDIELEAPSMDVGEVQLGPEDDVLRQLFANEEVQQAQQAQGDDQGQQKQAHAVRTAATRTIGARPTQGVSQIGGTPGAGASGADAQIQKLSSMWGSSPDVREAFGLPVR